MITIESNTMLEEIISANPIVVVVFSTHTCSICKPLKDNLSKRLEPYKNVVPAEVFIEDVEAVKGAYQIFTVPIVLLFTAQKEAKRYSAGMDTRAFIETIDRYSELFR